MARVPRRGTARVAAVKAVTRHKVAARSDRASRRMSHVSRVTGNESRDTPQPHETPEASAAAHPSDVTPDRVKERSSHPRDMRARRDRAATQYNKGVAAIATTPWVTGRARGGGNGRPVCFLNALGANWLPTTWGEASGGERENPGAGRSRGSPRQGWLGQPPSAQAGLRP